MNARAGKPKGVVDSSRLSGPEKAAVVLLALGEDHAGVWKQLDEEEIKVISQAMAGLGQVTAGVVEDLLVEFVSGMGGGNITGSIELTQRLLASIMPGEKVDTLMEEIRGPAGRTMWDKLGNVNEAVLANYLKNEYPQTVAVVLSKIKSEHAARVLTCLPEDFALECVTRMLRMEPVQREILDKIEQTLRTEFMSNLARTSKRDSHEMMADIFNAFDRQTETRFITALEERNREAAERIRALMFVFEDLSKLDPGGVQTQADLSRRGGRGDPPGRRGRRRSHGAAQYRQPPGPGVGGDRHRLPRGPAQAGRRRPRTSRRLHRAGAGLRPRHRRRRPGQV